MGVKEAYSSWSKRIKNIEFYIDVSLYAGSFVAAQISHDWNWSNLICVKSISTSRAEWQNNKFVDYDWRLESNGQSGRTKMLQNQTSVQCCDMG